MTRRFFTIAASCAALTLSACASAQLDQPMDLTPVNVSVRVGVVLPLDSALADVGNPLIGLGLEYQLPRPLLANGDTYFSLDYFTKSMKFEKGSVTPICINQRFYTGTRAPGRRTYAFLGLGVAIVDVTSSNTVACVRGGLGAELGDRIFFEAAGVLSDRASNARANSVGFYIGYRF